MRRQQAVVQILKAGVLYFAFVFGASFVLGAIRIMWVVPRFCTRIAELIETPIMLVITIISARWIVRHLAVPVPVFHEVPASTIEQLQALLVKIITRIAVDPHTYSYRRICHERLR